jgi:hypothetical protein
MFRSYVKALRPSDLTIRAISDQTKPVFTSNVMPEITPVSVGLLNTNNGICIYIMLLKSAMNLISCL